LGAWTREEISRISNDTYSSSSQGNGNNYATALANNQWKNRWKRHPNMKDGCYVFYSSYNYLLSHRPLRSDTYPTAIKNISY